MARKKEEQKRLHLHPTLMCLPGVSNPGFQKRPFNEKLARFWWQWWEQVPHPFCQDDCTWCRDTQTWFLAPGLQLWFPIHLLKQQAFGLNKFWQHVDASSHSVILTGSWKSTVFLKKMIAWHVHNSHNIIKPDPTMTKRMVSNDDNEGYSPKFARCFGRKICGACPHWNLCSQVCSLFSYILGFLPHWMAW